jgi:hypothetical protein
LGQQHGYRIKPEKIRECIDPRDLNRSIKREHYPMKTIEEVVAGMPEAKVRVLRVRRHLRILANEIE